MKPTPKELLELYQTATESLEEMFRKYELTIAEQAEKIEALENKVAHLTEVIADNREHMRDMQMEHNH